MSPAGPLLDAATRLRAGGTVSEARGAFLRRVALGELVSVRLELQVALWAGVTMVASGAGLLVKEQLANLGPAVIALGIALAAALCLWYVARTASPFSRGRVTSATLAFDYVLLLAVLLIGTDLAFVETKFTVLGPAWPWHLLLLSLLQFAFAFRHDSRAVLALALASFAAWRGISLSLAGGARFGANDELLRLNALLVGAAFLGAGRLLRRLDLKAHFEPSFGNIGLLLALGAAVAAVFDPPRGSDLPWIAALALLAGATILFSFRSRRSDYFAQGVIAAYLGFLRIAGETQREVGLLYLVSGGSFGVLLLILWAHRRFKEKG